MTAPERKSEARSINVMIWSPHPELLLVLTMMVAFPFRMANCDTALKSGQALQYPSSGFSSASELERFARTSSFGGGEVTEHVVRNSRLWISIRKATSGLAVYDCAVFRQAGEHRFVMALYLPSSLNEYQIQEGENSLRILRFDSNSKNFVEYVVFTP